MSKEVSEWPIELRVSPLRSIDVTKNWTDYLYIINESSDEWSIKTKKNRFL